METNIDYFSFQQQKLFPAFFVALSGGFVEPFPRLVFIFFHADAFLVTECQIDLCIGVSLFGGLAVPFDRVVFVLQSAFPLRKTERELELSGRVSLFRSFPIQFDGFPLVLLNSSAVFIAETL